MGVSNSKLEDDKALLLCRERKRLIRQALDGRCSLAVAHVAYIQSLKNTGTALRIFLEPDAPVESSLYTSTSATPEPLALTDKSLSQFSYSSPSPSQHVELVETLSPVASPPHSGRFQVNYMKAGGVSSATVEERPPVSATVTLMSSKANTQSHTARSAEIQPSFEATPPLPETLPWDYFGLFNPIDNQFSFHDERALNNELENVDDIRRLREEEGIPDLEDEGERVTFIRRSESEVSEDEYNVHSEHFDNLSPKSPKKQNNGLDHYSPNASPELQSLRSMTQNTEHLNAENKMPKESVVDASNGETRHMAALKGTPFLLTLPSNESRVEKEPTSQNKLAPKDFLSSIKEIEYLFIKASESGNEIPRMLEANKVLHRPTFSERRARKSRASTFFRACLVCFRSSAHIPQEPARNAMKYLTWHRSASMGSSSSRNPLGPTSKDNIEDSSSNLFNSFYMNAGSHASTFDRLYAWEGKLYDEVKASGVIRRGYDMKCKLLRHQDSRGESPYKIDKTRATVKDLHSRIRVAIHRINSISKKIEELRDKELQPQLEELIESLSRMWERMFECHKLQFKTISIAYNSESSKISTQSESHRLAALHLENELNSLCSSFTKWMGAHKCYLKAIYGWLLKCVFPLQRKSSRRRQTQFSPRQLIAPPIFITCRDWLKGLEDLEKKEAAVVDAIKDLAVIITCFFPWQEKTHKKNPLSAFSSVPWKTDSSYEAVQTHRNEPAVDWNLCLQRLQSSLVWFFDRLNDFADSSLKMYAVLRDSIKEAHHKYDMPRK